mmetsp:Transcript_50030/g.93049  ORF Transcript_50030/g.93049 Transcript_50030/m.93049 type:complete len:420 (-) Transcript_50030:255-1514(-)
MSQKEPLSSETTIVTATASSDGSLTVESVEDVDSPRDVVVAPKDELPRPTTGNRPGTGSRPGTAGRPQTGGARPGTAGGLLAPSVPKMIGDDKPEEQDKKVHLSRLRKLQTVAVAQAVVAGNSFSRFAVILQRTTLGIFLHRSDKILTKLMSHGTRYFMFLALSQVFPITYASNRLAPTLGKKCNQPIDAYINGTVLICTFRVIVAFYVRRRMDNRNWPNQTFGESLGTVWNLQSAEDQGQTSGDGCVEGIKLNVMIGVVNFSDMLWWFFGFILMCANDVLVCADRVTIDGWVLVVYQLFNVFGASMVLDIALPYFYLEWDPEVDSTSNNDKKKSSADRKREMRRLSERNKNRALREADKKNTRAGKPRVIQVGPAAGGVDSKANSRPEPAWFMSNSDVPPRQRDIAVTKVAPAPELLV